MKRQEDLQLKLRERYRRLLVADMDAYLPQLRTTRDVLRAQPIVMGLIEEAKRAEPDLDTAGLLDRIAGQGSPLWTHKTEGGQVALIWQAMEALADGTADERILWNVYTDSNNINDSLRAATEKIFSPLFDYLIERVGEQSSILHVLDRYVRLVEWFDRDRLIQAFDADTNRGEAVYNAHLRRFLFRDGIDLPFTEAQSPSGESDALAGLHTEDPLVCEMKVFDAQHRDRRHVATGLHQALLYAQDYGKSEAYLVIVNVSGRPLQIESDGNDKHWPPFIDLAGVCVYILSVRARRLTSASKAGPPKAVRLTRDDLTDPDAAD